MFEEERSLVKLIEQYKGKCSSIKLSASKYTATLAVGKSLEVHIDPTTPAHEWLTVDLIQGTLSPVLFSDVPADTRKLLREIASTLKSFYCSELEALDKKNEMKKQALASRREVEKELLKQNISIYV